ncbi:unnamed protein product [Amoebophrya sp. A25]|nr:unnamed protein product [Amoebophrya sp. A25]|eukprot:GSA25T00017614001.1
MVLSPALQVSDSQLKQYVSHVGSGTQLPTQLPSLLKKTHNDSFLRSKEGKYATRQSKKIRYGGISVNQLDRSMPVPDPEGRRFVGAKTRDIDVNVYFPYSGDNVKMKLDPDLAVSAPRTPDASHDRFKAYWGKDADARGYAAGPQHGSEPTLPPANLKGKLSALTGVNRRDIKLLHMQSKTFCRGPMPLNMFGIQHGQQVDFIAQKVNRNTSLGEDASKLTQKERIQRNKFLPSLSSSVKKPASERDPESIGAVPPFEPHDTLVRNARKKICADPHHIMPKWSIKGKGLGDTHTLNMRNAGYASAQIYYYDYGPQRARGCRPDAVAKIRETFEKKRDFMTRQQASLSSPQKLASTVRVLMGKPLGSREVFRAWKDAHVERMNDKSEFLRAAGGGLDVRKAAKDARERRKFALGQHSATGKLPDINMTNRLW